MQDLYNLINDLIKATHWRRLERRFHRPSPKQERKVKINTVYLQQSLQETEQVANR